MSGWIYYIWIRVIVWFLLKLSWAMSRWHAGSHVLHARSYGESGVSGPGVNVTVPLNYYYFTDKLLSVGSMYRWLSRFTRPNIVDIIYTHRGEIKVARVDLINCVEMCRGRMIDDYDVSFAGLLGRKFVVSKDE